MTHKTLGILAYKSPEFRAFAMEWLGFDPLSEEFRARVAVKSIDIRLHFDECVSFKIEAYGQQFGRPPFTIADTTDMTNEELRTKVLVPDQ